MQQNKRRSLAELRRVDRAVGEKSVHAALSLFSADAAGRRGRIDKSKFTLFKPF
jgi:hypothetical protein